MRRQRAGNQRPVTVSPASMPTAAAAKSRPACAGAYGTKRDSQPTIRPFGTHRPR